MIRAILLAALFVIHLPLSAEPVEHSILVSASPLQIYNALTVDWQIRQWSGATAVTADARPGGVWRWTFSGDSVEEGIYESVERGYRLTYTHFFQGEAVAVNMEMIPERDSTRLWIEHTTTHDYPKDTELARVADAFWERIRTPLSDYLSCTPSGYTARPAGKGPHPAVLILHDRFGVNRSIRAWCDSLAAAGYVACAVDMFRGEFTADLTQAGRFVELVNPDEALLSAQRGLECMLRDSSVRSNRTAVWSIGFGTKAAMRLAAAQPKIRGVVVWQSGELPEHEALRRMAAPVFGVFADADVKHPRAEINAFSQQLVQAGIRADAVVLFGGREFSDPAYGTGYSATAVSEAWGRTLRFLDRQLRLP